MWYEPVLEYAIQALVAVVIGLIGLAVAYLTGFIKRKSEALQEKTKTDFTYNLIANLQHVVLTAVEAAEQRVAADLRLAVKDGKADKAELYAIADSVKRDVLDVLGAETVDLLQKTFGDIDILISNLIESAVTKVKEGKN